MASITVAQRFEAQRRRANLWKLGGFASLIMTCLAGMFAMVSALADPNIQTGLGAAASPSGRAPTQIPQGGNTATEAPTRMPTARPTATVQTSPTLSATPQPTEFLSQSTAVDPSLSATPTVTLVSIPAIDEADKYTRDHPNDGLGFFTFYLALMKAGRYRQAQVAFQTGVKLIKDNPALCLGVGRQLEVLANADGGSLLFGWPTAVLFVHAYANGFDVPAIRNEAGQYLFNYARIIPRQYLAFLKDLVEANKTNKGAAGLYAFDSIAFLAQNMLDEAKASEVLALSLNSKLAEAILVEGILYVQGGGNDEAQRFFKTVIADQNAPAWATSEATALLSAQETATPTKGF